MLIKFSKIYSRHQSGQTLFQVQDVAYRYVQIWPEFTHISFFQIESKVEFCARPASGRGAIDAIDAIYIYVIYLSAGRARADTY